MTEEQRAWIYWRVRRALQRQLPRSSCRGRTTAGEPCKRWANMGDDGRCWQHTQQSSQEYMLANGKYPRTMREAKP